MRKLTFLVSIATLLTLSNFSFADTTATGKALPDNSVYHIESSWQDQHGEAFSITELQGSVRLVAFVYTYCEHTCPIIISRIKSILRTLSEDAKKNTIVTLVTLDPERDTVERVKEYMKIKDLDDQGWQILVGSPDDVLELSALFDVRYKPMGESDIAHSNVITLLDKQGVIRLQLRTLSESTQKLTELIEQLN